MNKKPQISVVIPIYNEEPNLEELIRRVQQAMLASGKTYELIMVDDGSRDGSWQRLLQAAEEDRTIMAVRFRRNFGQTAALAAGFDQARGNIIVTLDADLQNEPADIPAVIRKLEEENLDMVSGWRKNRRDPFITRIVPSFLANWIISRTTGVHLHDLGCGLKAYRKEILNEISLYGEMHRFIPILAFWVGAQIGELEVRHHPRFRGTSKYGLSRTFRVILDLITVKFLLSYSTRPIQIFGAWGLWSIILGGLSGITTVLMRIFEIRTMTRNPLLAVTTILLIVGVQFILLGLLGEINIRTYYESQGKQIYKIRNSYRRSQEPPENPPEIL